MQISPFAPPESCCFASFQDPKDGWSASNNLLRARSVTEVSNPHTATGATIFATGATVTFSLQLTTYLVSIGPGTTVTLTGTLASVPSSTTQTPSSTTGTVASESAVGNTTTCQVYGDTDIIGLGVRLGLYLQLLSNIVVVYKSKREGVASIMLTNIFMTAVFVAHA